MLMTGAPSGYDAGIIPSNLERIPSGYMAPAEHAGTLERLDYTTFESFSYGEKTQPLNKYAWVYVPYGYSEIERYDILYLSHGGWSDQSTFMGSAQAPHVLKNIVDHAIEDGKIRPVIVVLPTYNNESDADSGDYDLSIRLTANFHNELVGDLMPAVESRWRTFAETATPEGFAASRRHRAFGGFSMGSVNTWRTFEHCLAYFSLFAPMSGNLTGNGHAMAAMADAQGFGADDFFIFGMTGSRDFAFRAFNQQMRNMAAVADGPFVESDTLAAGARWPKAGSTGPSPSGKKL